MGTWQKEKKIAAIKSLTPTTKNKSLCPDLRQKCVYVCVLNIFPPRHWHSCKTSSKMPLRAIHQIDQTLRLLETSNFTLEPHLSHHHQIFDRPRQPNTTKPTPNSFPSLGETHKPKAENLVFQINKPTLGHSVLPNWFQLLLPHHWHCNKWAVFYQSCNSQTCESNQVHRRLWLETHAAFLSYDLITRLFSSTVKGGLGSQDCTFEFEEVLSGIWSVASSGAEPRWSWWHRWRSW